MKTTIIYHVLQYGNNVPIHEPYRVTVGEAKLLMERYPMNYYVRNIK